MLIIKLYINCGIIAVVMSIILSIIGKFLSTAQKHNTPVGNNWSTIGHGLVLVLQ